MSEIIYTDTIGYPEKRNIIDLPHSKYQVEKRLNVFRMPNALYFKYYNRSQQFFLNSHIEMFKAKNIHHFFNTISFGNAPWLTTFETILPRWGQVPEWLERKGVELLAGKHCKKLIAISECTMALQAEYLNNFPDLKEVILNKTVVLHPPQKLLVQDVEERKRKDENLVKLLFVGNQICGKGGREAINVVLRLFKEGAPIKLTIISAMEPDHYASHTTLEDVANLKRQISENSNCVELLGRQPYERVVQELLKADVALLPTYADTYGYFVLEAQAAGCPVITTNIRALPEINNNDCGWLIEVPKDIRGNGLLRFEHEKVTFSTKIENELYRWLLEICCNSSIIKEKGAKALKRIKKNHNPQFIVKKLESFYNEANM